VEDKEVSGVRERPCVGCGVFVRDHEIRSVRLYNETDMMVWLATHDPFLSHKDYQIEVSDYLFSHFDEVFTFHPDSGRVTHHTGSSR